MSESVQTRKKRKHARVSSNIPSRVKEQLTKYADEHDLTVSETIYKAIKNLLGQP